MICSRQSTELTPRLTKQVLLVGFEPSGLGITKKKLVELGYDVLTASCDRDARSLLRANGRSIDLVIVDSVLPELGGARLVEQVRGIVPTSKVLAVTGANRFDSGRSYVACGADAVLLKPYESRILEKLVARLTARSIDQLDIRAFERVGQIHAVRRLA